MAMKTVEEIVGFISLNYRPGNVIDYQDFDLFCGIDGLSWLERQHKRTEIVKRVNTKLRRGITIEDNIEYCALWVGNKGMNGRLGNLVLVDIGDSLLKESERAFKSAAMMTDEIMRALAKAVGESGYESKVHGRKIEFRGPHPVMSPDVERNAKLHLSTLQLFAPTITTMLGVADQARKFYEDSFGPLRLGHDASNKAA